MVAVEGGVDLGSKDWLALKFSGWRLFFVSVKGKKAKEDGLLDSARFKDLGVKDSWARLRNGRPKLRIVEVKRVRKNKGQKTLLFVRVNLSIRLILFLKTLNFVVKSENNR
jgi:hypothetical protein